MKYSALRTADFEASSTQEAAGRVALASARERFGELDGHASGVTFTGHGNGEQSFFEFEAMIGLGPDVSRAHKCTFALWVAGTHRVEHGKIVTIATLTEALQTQKKAVLTGEAHKQAIPGTLYGYARLFMTGKMKCVGMIPNDHRKLYAEHFAGLLDQKPFGTGVAMQERAFLVLVPEYMDDQITEPVARLVSRAEYEAGRLVSNREHQPII